MSKLRKNWLEWVVFAAGLLLVVAGFALVRFVAAWVVVMADPTSITTRW